MTELPKLNDHVRAVVEGRVSWVGDRTFRVGDGMDSSVICKASDHLISVETVRPPVAVNDVIETAEELNGLPRWTTVIDRDGDAWQRTLRGWRCTSGDTIYDGYGPFTVVYLSKAKDEDRSPFAVLWGDKTVVVYTYDEERGWIYRNSDSSEWGRSGWQSRKEIMSLYEKEVPLPEWFTAQVEGEKV
jgi:hypothetical protein